MEPMGRYDLILQIPDANGKSTVVAVVDFQAVKLSWKAHPKRQTNPSAWSQSQNSNPPRTSYPSTNPQHPTSISAKTTSKSSLRNPASSPPTIKWHFIGGLQSNKCVTLARDVRGLWAVESVDTEKKASLLNKGRGERTPSPEELEADSASGETDTRLRIYVQVNTSGEENKAGIEPGQAAGLARFIRDKCPRLKLQGVMTIGAIARSKATTVENENEDFVCLRETRDRIVSELGLSGEEAELELSMGMSSDFEGAIALGSDQVRVGTTIFGDRPPKAEARVV
ncbi:hypothetical protein N7448_002263 [Penicillium atrosanguineum]|nr:hypothetical protein N7448_002263 [Penicillium atrosanguineum]